MCAISAWRSSYCAQSIRVLSPFGRPLEKVGVSDDRHTLRKLDECLALHARMIPLTPRHMWFPCRSCEPATQNQYAPTYAYADSYSPLMQRLANHFAGHVRLRLLAQHCPQQQRPGRGLILFFSIGLPLYFGQLGRMLLARVRRLVS